MDAGMPVLESECVKGKLQICQIKQQASVRFVGLLVLTRLYFLYEEFKPSVNNFNNEGK